MEALFDGVGVALVTPFTEDGVDFSLLRRLIDRQIEAGVDALVVLGTTGEPCTMTAAERRDTLSCAVEQADGRVPLIAGVGGNDTRAVAENARMAEAVGADGLLVVTPYYNNATQAGLIAHYTQVARATRLPIILYNVPARTGLNLLPETARCLSELPNVCGLKEASGALTQLDAVVRTCGGLCVYCGCDELTLPALALGARGVISVTANVAPRAVKALYDAWRSGDTRAALARHQALMPLNEAMFCEVNPIPVKAALCRLGYGDGRLRLPLTELSEKFRPALYAALETRALNEDIRGEGS